MKRLWCLGLILMVCFGCSAITKEEYETMVSKLNQSEQTLEFRGTELDKCRFDLSKKQEELSDLEYEAKLPVYEDLTFVEEGNYRVYYMPYFNFKFKAKKNMPEKMVARVTYYKERQEAQFGFFYEQEEEDGRIYFEGLESYAVGVEVTTTCCDSGIFHADTVMTLPNKVRVVKVMLLATGISAENSAIVEAYKNGKPIAIFN